MKLLKTRPTKEGQQFVVVWEYDEKLWSDTYRISDGEYLLYTDESFSKDYNPAWTLGYPCQYIGQ